MDDYILSRLRIEAAHVITLAEHENRLQHSGLKGRFRELLIDNILTPWLPPYISCGTGMIIAAENKLRESTQDDIIIYDKSLVPPILASSHASEGVFLFNSVIARIEGKSTLRRIDVKDFIKSSLEIAEMKFTVVPNFTTKLESPFNLLFAFTSDAQGENDPDFELKRLCEVMAECNVDPKSGIVPMLCIPGKGFWKIGIDNNRKRVWQRLNSNSASDHLVWFVGCVSSSCFIEHAQRQGRNPSKGLEGGIGYYLPHPFVSVN
jgi:hypothetical protein